MSRKKPNGKPHPDAKKTWADGRIQSALDKLELDTIVGLEELKRKIEKMERNAQDIGAIAKEMEKKS